MATYNDYIYISDANTLNTSSIIIQFNTFILIVLLFIVNIKFIHWNIPFYSKLYIYIILINLY
jgi:hypothetical protein